MRLRVGEGRWLLCLLPTRTSDPSLTLAGLALRPDERIEALLVLDGASGDAALASSLGLAGEHVHRASDRAFQKRGMGLELDDVTVRPSADDRRAVTAFWFGEEDVLRIGADLPLDAWARPPNPSAVVGTLRSPRGKDERRLQEWGETGAIAHVHSVEILSDVVGASAEPWASRLPTYGTRVSIV